MTLYEALDSIPFSGSFMIKVWDHNKRAYVVERPYHELDSVSRTSFQDREVLYVYPEEINFELYIVFEISIED